MELRKVTHKTVLGIDKETLPLKKGDEIQTFETDVYGRVRVFIDGKEITISKSMLERISNKSL